MNPKGGSFRIHTINIARALARRYEVVIVSNFQKEFTPEELSSLDGLNPVSQLRDDDYFSAPQNKNEYLVYQFGNNEHYFWLLDKYLTRPGAVIVHDLSLFWLMSGSPVLGPSFMAEEVGALASIIAGEWLDYHNSPHLVPIMAHGTFYNRSILNYATEIICHSNFAANLIREKFPQKPIFHLDLTPNFLSDNFGGDISNKRVPYSDGKLVFALLGYQSEYKRTYEVLSAFSALSLQRSDFHVNCIGKWDPSLKAKCSSHLAQLRARGLVTDVDSYVSEFELSRHIRNSDIVVNLRYPTAGESSGIGCQALSLGTPIMVNNYAAFQNLPDDACFKIDFSEDGDEFACLQRAFLNILDNIDDVLIKTRAAEAYHVTYGMDAYSQNYIHILEQTIPGHIQRRELSNSQLEIRARNNLWALKSATCNRDHTIHRLYVVDQKYYVCRSPDHNLGQRLDKLIMTRLSRPGSAPLRGSAVDEISLFHSLRRIELAEAEEFAKTSETVIVGDSDNGIPETIMSLLKLLRAAPIGCRLTISDNIFDWIVVAMAARSSESQSVLAKACLETYLEKKYFAEIANFSIGLSKERTSDYLSNLGRFSEFKKITDVYETELDLFGNLHAIA